MSVATPDPEGEAGWISPSSMPETESLLSLAARGIGVVTLALVSGTSTCGSFDLRSAGSLSGVSSCASLWNHMQQPTGGRSASCFLPSTNCSSEMYIKTRDLSVE